MPRIVLYDEIKWKVTFRNKKGELALHSLDGEASAVVHESKVTDLPEEPQPKIMAEMLLPITNIECMWCGEKKKFVGDSTKKCNRCWELFRRIQADPELARKMLDSLPEKPTVIVCSLEGAKFEIYRDKVLRFAFGNDLAKAHLVQTCPRPMGDSNFGLLSHGINAVDRQLLREAVHDR